MYIFGALLLAAACTCPALAHNGEDAHSAAAVPQANVPMELVAGVVVRTVVENTVTGVTTQYVALRGDDGQRVVLNGQALDALQDGARAEAIGWRNGSTFTVSDFRTVVAAKAQTATSQAAPNLQVEGTLLLAHLDFLDSGRGEYLYVVRDDAGHVTRLNLASGVGLEPGMRVTARGTLSTDGKSIDVDVLTISAPPAPKPISQGHPVLEAVTNNVLVILLKFTDSQATTFTQAQVQDVMTNAATGVASYYNEVSYGQEILNVTVTDWLVGRDPSTHAPVATPPGCDYDTMGTYGNTAATDAGFTGTYQNRFYVMPPNGACGWLGVAYIGGNTSWSNGINDIKVYAHELGHNFGLFHAASLTCAGGASIGGTCTSSEYGDPFDVMGNISAMHFNATQKAKLGWLPTTSVKTQGSGFQQYTLDALEIGSGSTYAVTIPIPANPNRTYWIEYRQPIGFDAGYLNGLPASDVNGAQIRVANPFETCTGCQSFLGLTFSDDTELLDMTAAGTPGDFSDARLAVGSTFTDSAYGISVQVVSANPTQLVLNVTTPGGTPTTTTLVSSLNPSIVGNNVTFTASVAGSAPTGTVAFSDGGATITGCGAVALVGGGNAPTANCTTNALSVGTHSIVAAYAGDGSNSVSSSSPLSQVVNSKPATTTSVVSSINPSMVGGSVTFTASVIGTAPTGTVNFTDGGITIATCGAVALTGAGNTRTAACSTSTLGAATHSIVAAYSGDAGNSASSSVTLSQVVNKVASTTGLASSANPANAGVNVNFTATVTGTAPTGTVAFSDGGATIVGCGAVALVGSGNAPTAICTTSALSAGTHSIVAVYAGNAGNAASSSAALSQVVNPGSSTATVSSSANPTTVGTSITFTASVIGTAPTGTVNFTDGGTTIATCGAVALTGAGNTRTAACSTSALSATTHNIVAAYSGDAGNSASNSATLSQVVNKVASTTGLASSANPANAGVNVNLTATVTGTAPTGTVAFSDGGATIAGCGAVALIGAGNTRSAVCSTSTLSAATHNIVAAYAGDAGNAASSSTTLSQIVNAASSTATVSSSANPAIVGTNVTFTASVVGTAPTGTVNFTDGGTTIATCGAVALTGVGNTRTAACSTNALSAGTHSVVAAYAGNAGNAASSSAPLSQVVNPAASTTAVFSSANPILVGASVMFSAFVTGNAPTGTVNFTNGGTTIGSCGAVALGGSGNTRTATCSTSALSAGTHSVVAAYAGDSGNAASSSAPLSQVVNPGSSTTAVSSSANPALVGTSVTFTASVTGNVPTGTVHFTDGGTTIGTCSAVALTGSSNPRTATCTTNALSTGTHSVVAAYGGNAGNAASSSVPLSQSVTGPTPVVTKVSSRRMHGAAGVFDLPLSLVSTNPTTEPRLGPAQTIVFTFNKPITSATAAVTKGTAIAAAPTVSGNSVIVSLTGVTNRQYVTIALSNVKSADGGTGGTGSVRIGFLAGDVSQNRVVTLADVGLVSAALAQPVTALNYLKDINASGTLTLADKAIINANLSTALPPP